MTGPATPRQRLILAAAVAFVLDFALGFITAHVLPGQLQTLTLHDNSLIQPVNCVVTAISMCCGGWIGGRRFLPVGVLLMLLLQLLALALLTQIAHSAMPQRPLRLVVPLVLSSHVLGLGLQLLAAALGVIAGAALHARRPLVPLST